MFAITLRDSALGARVKEKCERNMEKKLAKKPWIADHRSYSFYSAMLFPSRVLRHILSRHVSDPAFPGVLQTDYPRARVP